MKRLDEYERNVNECQGINVGYYHRWKVDKIAEKPCTDLAIPKLESGDYLPLIRFQVILKCAACGLTIWYTHRDEISVISKNCEVVAPL